MPGAPYHADFGKAKEAVVKLVKSGCPKQKIFLGIPAYGRHRDDPGRTKTYAELVDVVLAEGITSTRLPKMQSIENYLIDSPDSVAAKVRYAMQEKLGGIFFWELGQDKKLPIAPSGLLLTAAAQERETGRLATRNGENAIRKSSKDEL
jgi:GH18 family chitinase